MLLRLSAESMGKRSGVGAHYENLGRKCDRSCGYFFILVFVVPRHLEPVVPAGKPYFVKY